MEMPCQMEELVEKLGGVVGFWAMGKRRRRLLIGAHIDETRSTIRLLSCHCHGEGSPGTRSTILLATFPAAQCCSWGYVCVLLCFQVHCRIHTKTQCIP